MNMLRRLVCAIFFLFGLSHPAFAALDTKTSMPEFDPNLQWLHNASESRKSLEGNVVVVYFWSLSNYESVIHLPFLNQLQSILQPYHFKVIAIYVPHYEFEKSNDTVSALIKYYNLTLPLARDNENRMPSLYQTFKIPTFYLIDARGRIKKTIFNEYDYPSILRMVLGALRENTTEKIPSITEPIPQLTFSPSLFFEISLGYQRLSSFGNLEKILALTDQEFQYPDYMIENQFYLKGSWRFESDRLKALINPCSLRIRTSYKSMNMIVDPIQTGTLKATLTAEGLTLDKDSLGKDANQEGNEIIIKIDNARLYNLVNLPNKSSAPISYEITFKNPVDLYGITLSDAPYLLVPKKAEGEEKAPVEEESGKKNEDAIELSTSYENEGK